MNWTLHCGDALSVLKTLEPSSVQCVVTSPPYWSLRDYGHDGQIGLEPTPDEFVAALVGVFAEARRVLADDGVCWLNIGDSYAGSGKGGNPDAGTKQGTNRGSQSVGVLYGKTAESARQAAVTNVSRRFSTEAGFKAKDLIGVPWRVAFALQADGWYLRSDVLWSKPNPMPESVTDRPTKAHEYVFLLSKSPRYYYDADAIRLPVSESMLQQMVQGYDGHGLKDYDGAGVQNPSSVKARIIEKKRRVRAGVDHSGGNQGEGVIPFRATQGANARSVWTIPTEPSPYEHFAVMPRALARKCIMAGCPSGGTVLDPFAGVCTTGVVALEEGRSFVGIELNPRYHAIGRERLANVAPLLATEVPA